MLSIVVVIVTCILFSAFFSGMEIAFISSNKLKLEIEKQKSKGFKHIADIFLKNPGQYITTILVGNNIALVIYSLNMSLLLNKIAANYGYTLGDSSIILETIISTIIIIFTAEFMPKAIVKNNPNFYMRAFAAPIYLIYIVLYPFTKLFTGLSVLLLKVFGPKVVAGKPIAVFDRVDLAHLIDEATDSEVEKAENEIKLFQNAMEFTDLRVRDCMVPRVDIEAVDVNESIEVLTKRFVDTSYSRILVYDGSVDNIIGYVNTKSLFTEPATIRDVLIEVDYVPESLLAQKLLTMLIKKRRTIAVVIDEYGGTAGLVSMEDALEEIFGEIEDEHDAPELVEKVVGDRVYVLSGRLEVDYLNEKYELGIPESEEYDTLAGYIIYYNEDIPTQGDTIKINNKEIKILKVSSSKLDLVRVSVV